MKYNEIGNTGIKVSEIGMGCEGFLKLDEKGVKSFVDRMDYYGINVIDLYAPNPEFRANLGKAMRRRRHKFVLQAHLCSVWKDGQYLRTRKIDEVKAGFEEQLRLLETDHVEICMIHYVDSMADWAEVLNGEVMAYARGLKETGVAKCLGLSSHNPEVALAAVETGLIDVLMFSVNPCYDLMPADENVESLWDKKNYENQLVNMDPQRQKLYETCQTRGVAITVMKAFGGGDLLDAEQSLAGVALTANQCLHYALTRPAVVSVMIGAKTFDDIDTSFAYEQATDKEKDYTAAFAAMPKISWEGHCMYCGHCAPCPRGIVVADVMKFLNLAIAQGEVPETVREHYGLLEHHAQECVSCKACVSRCPFHVPVLDNLKKAVAIFGK